MQNGKRLISGYGPKRRACKEANLWKVPKIEVFMEQTCVLVRERYLYMWNFPSGSSSPNWKLLKSMTGDQGNSAPTACCRFDLSAPSIRRERRMEYLVPRGEAMESDLCRVVDVLRRGACRTTHIAGGRPCPYPSAGANPCFGAFAIAIAPPLNSPYRPSQTHPPDFPLIETRIVRSSITPDMRSSRANFSHFQGLVGEEMIGDCKTRWISVW